MASTNTTRNKSFALTADFSVPSPPCQDNNKHPFFPPLFAGRKIEKNMASAQLHIYRQQPLLLLGQEQGISCRDPARPTDPTCCCESPRRVSGEHKQSLRCADGHWFHPPDDRRTKNQIMRGAIAPSDEKLES